VFQDLSTGKRIGSRHERGGIYYLDDRVTPTGLVAGQPDQFYFSTGAWVILRCKSYSLLFLLSPLFSLGCKYCELGKHHRATFQSRVNNRNSFVFELVHSDV